MADLSRMSDKDLIAATMPKPAASRMSDSELEALAAGAPQDTAVRAAPENRTTFIDNVLSRASGGLTDKALAALQASNLQPLNPGVEAGSWGERYSKNLQNTRSGLKDYAVANPKLDKAANAAAVVAPMLVMGGAGGGVIRQGLQGAGLGAAFGFGGTDDSSLSENALAVGGGALLGGLAGVGGYAVGNAIGSGVGRFNTRNMQSKTDAKAASKVFNTMRQQGASEQDLVDFLQANSAGGKPMTLMDMGENTPFSRLGRKLVTLPGKPSEEITTFLNTRQEGQRGRVLQDIDNIAPNTDTYAARKALNTERSVNSDPLYVDAFNHAGVGPVDFEASRSALISATSAKAQLAKQIKAIEKNSPGALASRGAAGKDVRDNYMSLQQQMQEAEFARRAAASEFENAQAAISAIEGNQPLTDERLAAFMKDRDIRSGMERGLDIQKRRALANDEEFDPAAYAITGYNDKGMPQVGPVPTWRTLHAGREGLDQIINEFKDQFGNLPKNKLTDSYVDLRKAYDATLKRLNPKLIEADAAWSGPSQKKDAISLGQDFTKADPEQITMNRGRLNAETDPYYQMGAGRNLRDATNDTTDNRNIKIKLAGDETARQQIKAAFGDVKAKQLIDALGVEDAMTLTRNFVKGGSNSVNKLSDILDDGWAKRAAIGGVAGGSAMLASLNPLAILGGTAAGAVGNVVRPAATQWAEKKFADEAANLVLAKIVTGTGKRGASELSGLLGPANKRRELIANAARRGGLLGSAAAAGSVPLMLAPSR